jgi:DNA helicase-4
MLGAEIALTLFVLPASIIAILLLSYRYYKRRSLKQLRDKESEIEQAYNELLTIWDRDRYLEHRTITQWLKDWSHLKPIISKNVNKRLVSSELKTKINRLFWVFQNTEKEVSQRNESFIQKEMVKFKDLFDSVEKYPLTESQIRSIVTDEYSNLVIAGAGTGKTSTIVGKTAYILEKGLAKPSDLLLLSFERDAKQEMFSRIKSRLTHKLEVKTFHSFGLGIIAEVEGTKPSVSTLSTDNLKLWEMVETFIFNNLKDEVFSKLLNEYFLYHYHQYKSMFNFKPKVNTLTTLRQTRFAHLRVT